MLHPGRLAAPEQCPAVLGEERLCGKLVTNHRSGRCRIGGFQTDACVEAGEEVLIRIRIDFCRGKDQVDAKFRTLLHDVRKGVLKIQETAFHAKEGLQVMEVVDHQEQVGDRLDLFVLSDPDVCILRRHMQPVQGVMIQILQGEVVLVDGGNAQGAQQLRSVVDVLVQDGDQTLGDVRG